MILLGVTGSIAAYKAVEILRRLLQAGRPVQVMMTPAATQFVGPLTFQGLSGRPVLTDVLDPKSYAMPHLHAAESAGAILVAPASADALSNLARGGAADIIGAALLGAPRSSAGKLKIPVFLAPAMHESMWLHPAVQANVKTLKSYGYRFIGPVQGALGRAGDQGQGRMSEPAEIVKTLLDVLPRS